MKSKIISNRKTVNNNCFKNFDDNKMINALIRILALELYVNILRPQTCPRDSNSKACE